MPGYDGTGPRGRGPMTGWGDGYCLMQIPQDPDRPGTGFVGLSGTSVTIPPLWAGSEVRFSSLKLAGIRNALYALERCLDHLETTIHRKGGTRHGTRGHAASGGSQAPWGDKP